MGGGGNGLFFFAYGFFFFINYLKFTLKIERSRILDIVILHILVFILSFYYLSLISCSVPDVSISFFFVKIKLCCHQVAPPVKIMPRPFLHKRGIPCGTTCDKVRMSKMITVKDMSAPNIQKSVSRTFASTDP